MFYIMKRLPNLCGSAFDATGNGGYLAEQAALEFGSNMVDEVSLSQSWYHEWMPKLKAEFESFNVEVARDQSPLDDLLSIKVVNGIPCIDKGRQKDLASISGKGKRHGDFAVALVMAIRASHMNVTPVDFIEVPVTSRGFDNVVDEDSDDSLLEQRAW